MTKRQKIELILAKLYEYRYNVLDGTIQFRPKAGEAPNKYQQHTDYEMNSIIRKIDDEGETPSESMYCSIIKSDFTPRFHPVRDYFYKYLPDNYPDQKEGVIQQLADTVKVPNPTEWYIALKRWMVASVANGLTEKSCQNHTCIVMTGGQGVGKTTWLSNLSPPPLNPELIYTGKIDLNLANKDTFNLLGIKFIINLDDQLRNLMKRDSETMKTLITHQEISIRRPFSKFHETVPRIANFLASINGEDFLAENENRRFLPIRVRDIDRDATNLLDINEAWKEALDLWQSGYKYWWDKDELEQAFPDMSSFAYTTDEMEALTTHFEIVEDRSRSNCTMNATEIVSFFKNTMGLHLSSKKTGEALKALGAIQVKVRIGTTVLTKYALNRLDLPSVGSIANPMLAHDKKLPF